MEKWQIGGPAILRMENNGWTKATVKTSMIATRSPLVTKTRALSEDAKRTCSLKADVPKLAPSVWIWSCGFVAEEENVAGMVEVPRG
jgi:hypothetical protein